MAHSSWEVPATLTPLISKDRQTPRPSWTERTITVPSELSSSSSTLPSCNTPAPESTAPRGNTAPATNTPASRLLPTTRMGPKEQRVTAKTAASAAKAKSKPCVPKSGTKTSGPMSVPRMAPRVLAAATKPVCAPPERSPGTTSTARGKLAPKQSVGKAKSTATARAKVSSRPRKLCGLKTPPSAAKSSEKPMRIGT
ncbi:hypothetical protein HRbin09_01387 [bacterium HR09]|nr:hypothetical protein HRbin09_01387 [bacterium HR09]